MSKKKKQPPKPKPSKGTTPPNGPKNPPGIPT